MALISALDLANDALFRAGEQPGASEWDAKVYDYLNRVYKSLCIGSLEFLPEHVNDWWWMRANGAFNLQAVIGGTCAVVTDSTAVTLPVPYTTSLAGRRLVFPGYGENYIVATHAVGTTEITLDAPYTGPTNASINFSAMKTTYDLGVEVASLMSPIVSFKENPQIFGVSPERMDYLFPVSRLSAGVPVAFCLEDERTIRFSHGGRLDAVGMRVEYRYRPVVADLIASADSIPIVPTHYRHVLADMTLVYLLNDKNDDRAVFIGTAVRSTLLAMTAENKRRALKMDQHLGQIHPRGSTGMNFNRLPRTESGLIIG